MALPPMSYVGQSNNYSQFRRRATAGGGNVIKNPPMSMIPKQTRTARALSRIKRDFGIGAIKESFRNAPALVSRASFFAPALAMGGIGTFSRSAYAGTKNLATKGYESFFAVPSKLKKVATGTGLALLGLGLGKYAVTGKPKDIIPTSQTASFVGGLRFSPIATIFGSGEALTKKAKDQLMSMNKPKIPEVPSLNVSPSFTTGDLPQLPAIPFSPISAPSISASPSYQPSVSVSAGGGGIPPELALLLLAGGVGGGYLLGRRKKKRRSKRKKNKKRRN